MRTLLLLALCGLMLGCKTMGLVHGADERVVYLDGSEVLVPIDPVRLNTAYNYKAVTVNQDVADATATLFTWLGGTVRPLAPVQVTGIRNAANDLTIGWQRQSRVGQGLRPFSDVPLAEEREVYEIEVFSGSTLKRTMLVTIIRADSDIIRWSIFSGSGMTFDDEGSLSFSGQTGDASAVSQPIDGDFVVEVGAKPDNTNVPANLYICELGNAINGAGNFLYIARTIGMTNDAITITDGVNIISATDDTDATAPARFFFVRKGSTLSIYRNGYFPTSHPIYIASKSFTGTLQLASNMGGGLVETATAYRTRVFHNENRRLVLYTAPMQTEDGFTPGNPIKLRIREVSAVVGRGAYVEATL